MSMICSLLVPKIAFTAPFQSKFLFNLLRKYCQSSPLPSKGEKISDILVQVFTASSVLTTAFTHLYGLSLCKFAKHLLPLNVDQQNHDP